MVPLLDGPISVCSRRRMSENERTEQESSWRTAVTHRREYPDESSNNSHMMIGGPLKGDTKKGVEDHQMEEIIMIDDILEEEDPLIEVEDPLIMEDTQMVEDPLEMDYIQDTLEDKDHLVHQGPLDQ